MQRKLLILSLSVLAIVGCNKQDVAAQPTENPVPQQNVPATAKTENSPVSAAKIIKSGNFVKGEHTTKGGARIITENGKSFLELDQNFKTDSGPDLFVILHKQPQPPIYGITEKDYVSVGRLQKTAGAQRYAIPDNTQIADFASAAIWCRQFNATFGYAAFTK